MSRDPSGELGRAYAELCVVLQRFSDYGPNVAIPARQWREAERAVDRVSVLRALALPHVAPTPAEVELLQRALATLLAALRRVLRLRRAFRAERDKSRARPTVESQIAQLGVVRAAFDSVFGGGNDEGENPGEPKQKE